MKVFIILQFSYKVIESKKAKKAKKRLNKNEIKWK